MVAAWRHVRRTYLAIGIFATLVTGVFIASVCAQSFAATSESAASFGLTKAK